MSENKIKKYKILGDSFKQYNVISKNTFSETKTNKISQKNIDEIIESFDKSSIEVFVYIGHKENIERNAIGKVLSLEKDNESIGLYANIEWFDDSIIEKEYFYPSIEMMGKKYYEDDNFIYWKDCAIKALAAVEYPASKDVDLLCASGIIDNNLNDINDEYIDKFKYLLEKLVNDDSNEAKEEILYLMSNDDELKKTIIDFIVEKLKEEKQNTNKELNLSAIDYNNWCNEYAKKQNAIRCSSKSESSTYLKARKLFKAGLNKEEIISIVHNDLVPIGIGNVEKINLSALDEDSKYSYIAKLFK